MLATRGDKVLMLLERPEEEIAELASGRARRLSRLIELGAPNFIVANELLMALEAIEALFRRREYNPHEDERVYKGVAGI